MPRHNSITIPLPIDVIPPWSSQVRALVEECIVAHQTAAVNPSVSTAAVVNCARGSGQYVPAIISGLLGTGGAHAPITTCRHLLQAKGDPGLTGIIPGFGNSFYPQGDPAWNTVAATIKKKHPKMHARIQELTGYAPKGIRPNAALYTAAVCEIANIPTGCEMLLFALARIPAWTHFLTVPGGEKGAK